MLFAIQGGVSGFVGSRSGACRKPRDGTKYFRRDTVLGNREGKLTYFRFACFHVAKRI